MTAQRPQAPWPATADPSSAAALAAMNARLDEAPDDWGTRLEMADLLDDLACEKDAAVQRWLARHRRHPAYCRWPEVRAQCHHSYWGPWWRWWSVEANELPDFSARVAAACLTPETWRRFGIGFNRWTSRLGAEKALLTLGEQLGS